MSPRRRTSGAALPGGSYRFYLVPNPTAINDLLSGKSGDLKRVMAGYAGRATVKAKAYAGERVKTRTGTYQRSISASFPRPDEFRIVANTPYAAYLEKGTTGHIIAGNPYLAWPPERSNQGTWQVHNAVYHPGNKGYDILTDAVLDTAKDIGF